MISLVKIPHLDRLMIQNYVGFPNFQKGEEYVLNQAILKGKRKNHLLTGLCQGHEFDPYRVEVIFNSEGIQQGYCSCPVGAGGRCKHIAALLLTWMETPETFIEWSDLKLGLQSYDASTLLELIDLLDDKSESSSEVIQAFSKYFERIRSPRLAKYARRIDEAFRISEFPWYHPDEGGLAEVAFSLDKVRVDADQLLQEGAIEEAIRIDESLIQQILQHLDDHLDPWGNLSEELKRCVKSVHQALQSLGQRQENLRLKGFRILFRLIEEQLHREINVAGEEAKQVILQHMQSSEREKIVAWVEAAQKSQFSIQHPQQSLLEDFLIDLQKDILEPEIYLTHYRETRQVVKLVDSLLALGRVEEAEKAVEQKDLVFQTLKLADVFLIHHQDEIAEKLVLNFSQHHPDLQALRWLKDFYQKKDDLQAALNIAKQILYLTPQFSYYQGVQELAQRLNQWTNCRQEIIDHFKKIEDELLLIEIYLDEKEFEKAIEFFEKISNLSYDSFKDPNYVFLALRLAEVVRYKHARFSLKIYQEIVDQLIKERNRESYRRAAAYLKVIQSIFEDLKEGKEWDLYFCSLLQTYRRLKALQDEIYQAGL